jgi:hypothetical protein
MDRCKYTASAVALYTQRERIECSKRQAYLTKVSDSQEARGGVDTVLRYKAERFVHVAVRISIHSYV